MIGSNDIPPAWQNVEDIDPDLRALYDYLSMHQEPWDGPAGLVITDGRFAVCTLDRNGLRPSRWVMTDDDGNDESNNDDDGCSDDDWGDVGNHQDVVTVAVVAIMTIFMPMKTMTIKHNLHH